MRLISLVFSIVALGFGCQPQVAQQECVPAEETARAATGENKAVERTFLSKSSQSGSDWCQGCVLSREQFPSNSR